MSNWNCCNGNTAFNIDFNDNCGCNERGTITVACGGCHCNDIATITVSAANRGCCCEGTARTRNRCDCGSAWTSERCGCRSWNTETRTGRNGGCGCCGGHDDHGTHGHDHGHGCGCC